MLALCASIAQSIESDASATNAAAGPASRSGGLGRSVPPRGPVAKRRSGREQDGVEREEEVDAVAAHVERDAERRRREQHDRRSVGTAHEHGRETGDDGDAEHKREGMRGERVLLRRREQQDSERDLGARQDGHAGEQPDAGRGEADQGCAEPPCEGGEVGCRARLHRADDPTFVALAPTELSAEHVAHLAGALRNEP